VTAGFLVSVLIIVCASLAGIAYGFGLVDNLVEMVFPEPTPTDTVAIAAEPETPIPATVTFTPSVTFEPTGTEMPTTTLADTETQMPTLTTTPTPKVVFEDDFKNNLLQWETWENLGESSTTASWPAEIILGEYLEIKGLGYDQVGVTSVQTVTLSQGLVIDFAAVVDTTSTASLYFDWHPGMEIRSPESIGPFYLVIDNATVRFLYNRDGDECDALLPESTMNHFRIEFGPEWEVTINVGNGEIKELCSVVIDEPEALEGHISFSGFGLVDSIRIAVP
jgi:hypothetical protein